MESLALHLVVILVVGSLRHNIDDRWQLIVGLAGSSAATASTSITTSQPPSLLVPSEYMPITTIATTQATMTSSAAASKTLGGSETKAKRSEAYISQHNNISASSSSLHHSNSQNASMNVRFSRAMNATEWDKSNNNINRLRRSQVLKANQFSLSASSDEHQSRLDRTQQRSTTSTPSTSLQLQRTRQQQQSRPTKTPRAVHRLVGGHIQNGNDRTANLKINATTVSKTSSAFFRRKSIASPIGDKNLLATPSILISTTTQEPPFKALFENTDEDDRDDDAALLDESSDLDNWDNGILRLSAGSGNEAAKSRKKFGDSKKTLSDQVREGKYGLIEQELFSRKPQRPGVISYLPNKEVPDDNEHNYGGLDEEDIWLAEDHLLVIKGGSLNDGDEFDTIDDYQAPGRQIKIPPNPKIPPPFPVQLEENGPIQLIGNSKIPIVNPLANESVPVYPASNENYTPSESDGDNEKNLLTRPRPTQDAGLRGPTDPNYFYPAPYPPWIFHNQTFVNPFLKTAGRPVALPGIGPFVSRSNGSLSGNETDDYDEDDPSLYYPPPYSFVYKNNYTSRVPPGPLVPGIVVPPPPHFFSRLEQQEKHKKPYRPSSTTTTTTTTEMPSRQIVTKITKTSPSVHTVTKPPHVGAINSKSPAFLPKKRPSTDKVQSQGISPVPVPVAVPFPIYPSKPYSTVRPNIVSFVPTSSSPTRSNTLSKTNPIYYEYYEANEPSPGQPTEEPFISNYIPTTPHPTVPRKSSKIYPIDKRPPKHDQHRNPDLIPPSAQPNRKFVYEDYVYITPKPEIRPNGIVGQSKPLSFYEHDVNVIRSTLHFYHSQEQLSQVNKPQTAKVKEVHDDNLRSIGPTTAPDGFGNFHSPTEFDDEPFRPMVTYSPSADDATAFQAIAFNKIDNELQAALQPQSQLFQPQQKFYTTTLLPVSSSSQPSRQKKTRFGAKLFQELVTNERRAEDFQNNQRTILTTQSPTGLSVENKVVSEVLLQQQQQDQKSSRLQIPRKAKERGFNSYYYGPPPAPLGQNNRFYYDPLVSPVRQQVASAYLPPHRPGYSLENDTNVNYAPNRPPINPDAEIIDSYQMIPLKPYQRHQQQYSRRSPSFFYQQPQFYLHPSENRGINRISPPPAPYQLPPNLAAYYRSEPQPQIPLDHDIQVNYQDPRPPINPDSENISHPNVVHIPPLPHRNDANHYRQPSAMRRERLGNFYRTSKHRRSNGQ